MCTSDILSFYKEELKNDDGNYISLLASIKGISKLEALDSMIDSTVEAQDRVGLALARDEKAKADWDKFREGYVAFHVAVGRYKLEELSLAQA
jgi:hypothetical protein